ncbi:MAG: transglutaminase-like domain-containing protein [Verrucomicrobiota bacterium]
MRGTAPQLIRTATFNSFVGTSWQARRSPDLDFQNLENRLVGEDLFYQTTRSKAQATPTSIADIVSMAPSLPAYTLRGSVSVGDPLPLPGDVACVSGFQVERIEGNTFGTIRVVPKDPVLNGTVFWRGGTQPDLPPLLREDLRVPIGDSEALRALVAEIGLSSEDKMPVTLAKLRTWFQRNFQYSKHLTIRQREGGDKVSSPMVRFLTTVRSGHCEYFATGAALLLRQAAIPARYSTGFAVAEYDTSRKEFIIRGTHGHAWCRVWDGSKWLDFDPTPPNWLTTDFPKTSVWQRMDDALTRLREDFFLWRTQPSNQLIINLIIGAIGVGLAGFVMVRLWRSRSVISHENTGTMQFSPGEKTPLHELEPLIRRMIGPRPVGEPYAAWITRATHKLSDRSLVSEAIDLHQKIRVDPDATVSNARERLEELARELRGSLRMS